MAEMYAQAPTDSHPHGVFTMMQRQYNLKGMWFMDTWPASPQRQLVIADPNLAAQITQINNLPKSATFEQYAGHIAGSQSMIFTEGAIWKKSRSLFNSSFLLPHLMTLIPTIVDDALIYHQIIGEHADSGEVRPIEETLARLMIDIMGHVVLDLSFDSLTTKNEFVSAFRSQISWTPSAVSTNPFVNLNPLRPFMHRYYTRKMNNYLEKVLDDRFAKSNRNTVRSRRKPAIDLALDEYTQQQKEGGVESSERGIDKAFKANAIDQMKSFIFAGHDTTSSTMAYAYLLLSQHLEELAKARAELDTVFGTDSSQTSDLIKQNPSLVNSLPFILGVLKETLRLFSPVMTVREGKGTLTYEGVTYDINGCMVFEVSQAIHRNAEYFPSPDEFIPERWVPGSGRFQEIPKDAYRPFEKGPRDCIGQQLAMLEMKIVLALTLRDFDFKEDYETWDRNLGRKSPGSQLDGRRGMFGQRAYQQLIATAKPADGLPGRFIRRNRPQQH
ncbi:cytochrome P450 [Hyaloscypha variabilis F]|uniref:Cytochrome P450 n=1 Tax=Hyaloscypha variabilis (strain UAMH 11265 / GT02V1 / F) TaxID=1149755 RepID=A0A2J6SDK8_HYAVF|nr:cytochrome P450 [Hyaloscypha variabilis F]